MMRTCVRAVFWLAVAATLILLPYIVGGLVEQFLFGTLGQ